MSNILIIKHGSLGDIAQASGAIQDIFENHGNEIILMMKGTSLASTVTLMDLTGVAKYIISTTFKPIEVFIVAGGIYLFMTFLIHNLIKYLERKYSFQ